VSAVIAALIGIGAALILALRALLHRRPPASRMMLYILIWILAAVALTFAFGARADHTHLLPSHFT
jgi:drug/metabolite transporter (DMT)-like permease